MMTGIVIGVVAGFLAAGGVKVLMDTARLAGLLATGLLAGALGLTGVVVKQAGVCNRSRVLYRAGKRLLAAGGNVMDWAVGDQA